MCCNICKCKVDVGITVAHVHKSYSSENAFNFEGPESKPESWSKRYLFCEGLVEAAFLRLGWLGRLSGPEDMRLRAPMLLSMGSADINVSRLVVLDALNCVPGESSRLRESPASSVKCIRVRREAGLRDEDAIGPSEPSIPGVQQQE